MVTRLASHSDQADGAGDRRRAPRVQYDAVVWVASYDGSHIPNVTAFQPVTTRDLSPSGISYVTEIPPKSRSILLLFHQPGKDPILVAGRVVHFLEYCPPPDRRFLVGCEMLRRLAVPPELAENLGASEQLAVEIS